jgi:4-diphosphocytidyl-2-C-methyl-D-erythritol kinase
VTLPNTLVVEAPAKVNLVLRVLARRADGYHDIESLVVPITVADRLQIHAHADPSDFRTLALSLEVRGDPDLVRPVPVDESNLIIRAASALAQRTEVRGFADFELEKLVPTAAGLGGGSSDAAAALRALNDLWGCGLGMDDLREVASLVGSDVPALLEGRPARVAGRGDIVTPSDPVDLDLVLLPFDFGVRTADAYRWWDEDGGPSASDGPYPNDLQGPVMRRHPRIQRVRDRLLEEGLAAAFMCGSGPTVAGVLPSSEQLPPDVEARLAELSGRPALYAAANPPSGT